MDLLRVERIGEAAEPLLAISFLVALVNIHLNYLIGPKILIIFY